MQFWIVVFFLSTFASIAQSQVVIKDVTYLPDGHPRHVLDIYKATNASNASKLPVVFWIHGGGWQTGDKSDVANKPRYFTDKGYLFVAC
ncbi:MAG: alpha/beta hydrolase, partial [Planctomycetota bacterium]